MQEFLVPLATFGTGGIRQWILDDVVTLVILVLGVAVLWAARSGNIAKGITIAAGMIVGVAVLGMATGNTANEIGTWIVDLFRA